MDPLGILLVYSGCTGESALGQSADGDQALHNGMGVFMALADGAHQSLVTVGGGLDRVVVILGEHTRLEFPDHLGALANGTHILDGNWTHPGDARLPNIGI